MLYRTLAGATVFLIATALPAQQTTRWTGEVYAENPWPEYPRPQMVRAQWLNLNGQWELAITSQQAARPDRFEDQALVPYPVESLLSGVQRRVEPDERLWYRRRFTVPEAWSQRVLLHFGAVDWEATVWVNDSDVGTHRGGYDAFTMEITDQVRRGEENEIVVAVWDPSDDGGKAAAGKRRDLLHAVQWYLADGLAGTGARQLPAQVFSDTGHRRGTVAHRGRGERTG